MKYIGQNVKSVGLKAGKECEKALYSAFLAKFESEASQRGCGTESLQTYLMPAAERNV
jgi:hypothetical protein